MYLIMENQAKAKEAELSDTLSPSKEKSSDDTTDAQMDDHELNEPIAKVALLKADELQGAQSETEAKQEIQQLRKELVEAQELARTSKQKCFELQAQLRKLQEDIDHLREEKENEISSTRNDLLSAQSEILLLQQVAEKAASERDADVAALQEELQTVKAELERWRSEASEYEKEIVNLQASFQLRCQQCEDQQKEEAARLQDELEKLRRKWTALEAECVSLKKENSLLECELQRREKELHKVNSLSHMETHLLSFYPSQVKSNKKKWYKLESTKDYSSHEDSTDLEYKCYTVLGGSSQQQSLALTSDLSVLELTRKELENKMGSLKEQHQRDAAGLKTLLNDAENQAKDVQKEYEKTQNILTELKRKFEITEQEKQSITDELKQCKDSLKLLQEKGDHQDLAQEEMRID
uniref:Uncharacterized protein n=1 Tax=Sphaerodactylus townsendi TaxID=933632 RepID=A0ACB8EHN1_9SAUR